MCVICQRNSSKQKRSQFRLSECQLDSGASRLQKAAEIKHDQRIKLGLRGEDLSAKEVKYHKTCYKRFTRCVDQVKLDKETEQDDRDGADSADDDVDEQQWEKLVDFIRVNILENRQVYKSKDLVKDMVFITGGNDCIRTDRLKCLLERHFALISRKSLSI